MSDHTPAVITDALLADVTRAIYKIESPNFEDEGQSLADMQFLDRFHGTNYVGMARAAIARMKCQETTVA